MKKTIWFSAKVIPGKQLGRALGFPTINLDNPKVLGDNQEGVYACIAKVDNQLYKGLLYFGPRLILGEKENILEIYLFDFDKKIYGQIISFQLKDYIRPAKNFPNFDEFKKQLASDCRNASKILLK
ncbi:hypothetical protein A3D03_05525 [Candidatus Gottesmanbacteria bacterium RIFCSPHIGHO2_02_FULL_40_13]|uniref:riboflavin kinase n=1 Tax=Candidatus Gottesmanbacteria bacterium RIFCSPHIGHO2_02_FULL_40_13 TaxID=1798384 RepID=A0A1F6A8U4_9BACT|nr:MAG: hypothetical protein A3D03_05525 [Candidatus Gottesmanbacteria bacterium RIFCSPHIGHO2_02_FULL_40_13]